MVILNGKSRHGAVHLHHKSSGGGSSKFHWNRLLMHVLSGLCCFYAGLVIGMSSNKSSSSSSSTNCIQQQQQQQEKKCPKCPDPVVNCPEIESVLQKYGKKLSGGNTEKDEQAAAKPRELNAEYYTGFTKNESTAVFPPTVATMAMDYGTVDRMEFLEYMNMGVPFDESKRGSDDVLMIYSSDRSLPDPKNGNLLSMNPKDALEHCQTVKVVLSEPYQRGKSTKCIAIVPQWESYNIYKYMRVPEDGQKGGANDAWPLRFVSRSHSDKNTAQMIPKYASETVPSFKVLIDYLQAMPKAHDEMGELIQKADIDRNGPLIVQVCNKGQSELLMNFVCTARARGLDTDRVFLFATDMYTYDLCQNLGLKLCYHNSDIFGDMPEKAAGHYADYTFAKMMMAKVYCVHLALTKGYSVLFQDVDLVWYQNPLPFFEEKELQEWDVLFQDDGARTPRYAPYSPNTGFYYVRHNDRTLFLFNRLLKMGDTIARYKSHQAALVAAINENVSWIGLKVKVFRWGDQNAFPGGVEFHRRKDFMKKLTKGETDVKPYIFHMSWTENKVNKKKFLQQLGEWRVKDDCDTSAAECCLAEPNIVCHYRDKPSIIPCTDSPPIDNGKPSFW